MTLANWCQLPSLHPLHPSVTFWLKLKCRHDGWTCCLLNNRLLCFSCCSSSPSPSPPALPCARKVSAHDYQPKCPMPSSDQWTHFSQSPRYLWYPVSYCYSLLDPVKLTFEIPYRHITALQCDCECAGKLVRDHSVLLSLWFTSLCWGICAVEVRSNRKSQYSYTFFTLNTKYFK